MRIDSKIYVAGSSGLVGSAIVKKLSEVGFTNIITTRSKDVDLTSQLQTQNFLKQKNQNMCFYVQQSVEVFLITLIIP